MKKILFLILILPVFASSQNTYWSYPMFLTDTLSDNINAEYLLVYNDGIEEEFVFYEKHIDHTATGMYMIKLWEGGSPDEVRLKAHTHYTNYALMDLTQFSPAGFDTIFLVFYERLSQGETDLFYMKYHKNGFFSDPVLFQGGPGKQQHCSVNFVGDICWEDEGKIKTTSFYIEDAQLKYYLPTVLDSGHVSKPDISNYFNELYVSWEKTIDDTSKLFYSQRTEFPNTWSEVNSYLQAGICNHGSYPNNRDIWTLYLWQNKTDSLWGFYYHDYFFPDSVHSLINFLPGYDKSEPSFVYQFIPVDGPPRYMSGILSCKVDSVGYTDIFANENYMDFEEISKISLQNYPDRNPQTFYGPWANINYAQFIVIWETFINDHWTLSYSHKYLPVWGNINENFSNNEYDLRSSPNPAKEKCLITFNSRGKKAEIFVYNQQGIKIKQWEELKTDSGHQSINWDLSNEFGHKVPPGLYICTLKTEDKSEIIKIIVN